MPTFSEVRELRRTGVVKQWEVRLVKPLPGVTHTNFGPYTEGAAHVLADVIHDLFPQAVTSVEPIVQAPLASWENHASGAMMD